MGVWSKLYEVEFLVKKALREKDDRALRAIIIQIARKLDLKDPFLDEGIKKMIEEKLN
ncbi:MAG: hypothetical protein PHV30_10695 [Candidatus Margulisbacteria bacterium]|nr:hypothetical protein [Candidatus Margulisiibacteriota bacterium]